MDDRQFNSDHKQSFFRFPIFLIISLGIHLGLFSYLVYSYRDILSKVLFASRSPKILVDLTNPRDDLFDPNKKVIFRYNYAGKGKLSPRPGQHLSGDFNPITLPESSSLEKPKNKLSTQKRKEDKKIKLPISDREELFKSKKGVREIFSQFQTIDNRKKSDEKRKMAIDTEDSLENRFWFDESEFLQLSSRNHPDAEFSLELANLLKKRFSTYVLGGGHFNFYHVKQDQAIVLASINSIGKISFEKMVKPSETQPYMNYLVSRVVDNPGIVKHLPNELREKDFDTLYFLFDIRFTGEPLRKWWMGFEFLPKNVPK